MCDCVDFRTTTLVEVELFAAVGVRERELHPPFMKSMFEISPITEAGSSVLDGAGVAMGSGFAGGAWKSVFLPESRSKNCVLVKVNSSSSLTLSQTAT